VAKTATKAKTKAETKTKTKAKTGARTTHSHCLRRAVYHLMTIRI